jgi:ADP-heptose:LPS heptosyltransferase
MDTGPMHLAGVMGTPAVAVFGRSDPRVHGPAPYLPGKVVAGPDARHWPTRGRRGLEPFLLPEPEQVVEAALEVLGAGSEAPPRGSGRHG